MTDPDTIKACFIAARGYWRPWTEALLRANPTFLSHYAAYAGHPARTGPLSARMVELIYVALDASATHLYEAGLTTHMRLARQAGASEADLFDVLHRVTLQGLSAVFQAADLLHEAAPLPALAADDPLRARIAASCPEHAASLLRLAAADPGYVAVLLDFLAHGKPEGGLGADERVLIDLALHACFTHADMTATRALIARGLELGIARPALLQAMQLGAHLAVHGAALGATVHARETAPAERQG
ncbi:carboxymuconolactone decarboxylase family protein [Bordetella hinzii]|uniref:carboxymuconolactone decarboxylase family protein n=1 Tax=Bordetella hinzii TaxID=103855 RepID=UPI0013EFE677|nr:carboxymuconolactone decarboxylase family protein [Bordetella hinzii]QII83694.1 carboxymuconolactone decarboxylase family protein [Bordetella hinzii]